MMTWTDILHPIKTIRNVRNEWYERREARAIFDLLEAVGPRSDLEVPPELHAEIMQQFFAQPATRQAGNLVNRGIILRCLYENWPDEVSMIGDDLVSRIVDEVLAGHRPEFRVPQGGFSFDLTPYSDTILNATSLLVSMAQLYIRVRHTRSHNILHASDEGEAPDSLEETEGNVEEFVRILTQYLTEERAVEPREATNLARMFIRVNRGGYI